MCGGRARGRETETPTVGEVGGGYRIREKVSVFVRDLAGGGCRGRGLQDHG